MGPYTIRIRMLTLITQIHEAKLKSIAFEEINMQEPLPFKTASVANFSKGKETHSASCNPLSKLESKTFSTNFDNPSTINTKEILITSRLPCDKTFPTP